ncbi:MULTISPECIES: host-nuclease inhibitor Gam family protein [Nitrosomonas]|uniref:Host-nuclease inhibitor protein Gam n=1 Tax=Nitrosomonas communis TaxID=44574 RepID=A0A0F7KDN2_9PROT|nr:MULTISPECIES: host-nuclease inhibitor Gam family protein [Nitrosomonas]AKH36877.1 host-nuclease inhibitor protein Gam [Nitrosomonas communis]TYP83904.1 phage host-nuclease inhibitor protein Gam [Nitrosomonas communis]UVS61981.1 host-nuclease inhibitor Gam family protein [Nitrosomonas sp. PLL12]
MAKTVTRLKTKAQAYVPQTRDEAAADIRKIGDLQRQLIRATTEMNDAIAHITQNFQPRLDAISAQLKTLQEGVQGYCEAHRLELTDGSKVKTANLITGEVQWRQRPPSVSIRGSENVIEMLKRLGLVRFVRTKEEVNKEAILNEPDEVRGVAGISVVTGVEDFVITPFEQTAEV